MSTHLFPSQRSTSPELEKLYAKECIQCGICCVFHCHTPFNIPVDSSPPLRFVQIGPRKDERTNRYMRIKPLKKWPGTKFNSCVALIGRVGQSVKCMVYDSRPSACGSYAPGSAACLQARRWGHMEPLDDCLGRS